jgi:hypothetical protein
MLEVDHRHRAAKMAASFRHPSPLLAYAMGNMQLLPDGNVILGWGNVPGISEFTPSGGLIMDLRLPWGHASYRGFRQPWSGSPGGGPSVAVAKSPSGSRTLYVSWNGATNVAAWQVSLGSTPSQLAPGPVAPRRGFETTLSVPVAGGYASVLALDGNARPLGRSAVIHL